MKRSRKLICALLAAALLVLTAAPAFAAVSVGGISTLYMGSTDGSCLNGGEISITGLKLNSKVTNVKTSNKSIVSLSSLNTWHSSYKDLDGDYSDEYHDASIYVHARKVGSATVSFKVDGQPYSRKITVKKYENPVSSFVIAPISKTNLKAKFAKSAFVHAKLKSKTKEGYATVTAAKGWKIRDFEWYDGGSDYSSHSFYSSKGVSTAKVIVPAMKKGGQYCIRMSFVNTATKCNLDVSYYFG